MKSSISVGGIEATSDDGLVAGIVVPIVLVTIMIVIVVITIVAMLIYKKRHVKQVSEVVYIHVKSTCLQRFDLGVFFTLVLLNLCISSML